MLKFAVNHSAMALIPALQPARRMPTMALLPILSTVKLSIRGTIAIRNPVMNVISDEIIYLFVFVFIWCVLYHNLTSLSIPS